MSVSVDVLAGVRVTNPGVAGRRVASCQRKTVLLKRLVFLTLLLRLG